LIQDPKIALDHKPGDDPADEKPRDGYDKLKTVTVGAVSGGIALGTIGGLIGLASLAVPGLGLIVVAGPTIPVVEIQGERCVDSSRRKMTRGALVLEPEDVREKLCRRLLVVRRHDRMIQRDARDSLHL
jgi:hypothetical protein